MQYGGISLRCSPNVSSRLKTRLQSFAATVRARLIRIYDVSTSRSSPSTAVNNSTVRTMHTNEIPSLLPSCFLYLSPKGGELCPPTKRQQTALRSPAGYPTIQERKGIQHPLLRGFWTGRRASLKRAALTYSTGRTRVARHTGVGSVFAISGNNDTGYHRCETSVPSTPRRMIHTYVSFSSPSLSLSLFSSRARCQTTLARLCAVCAAAANNGRIRESCCRSREEAAAAAAIPQARV